MTSTATPAVPRTKNTLTLPQQLKLARWCQDNVGTCQVETYPKLAAVAAATLEFTVTPANMSSTIEACEIERKKPDAPPTLEEQFAGLRQELDALRQDAGESKALRGTVEQILAGMRALTERVNRQERLEQPELGLPVPGFGETAGTAGLPFDTDVRENADPVYGV